MTFTETCVNTSKPGYSTLIKQAYAQIVTNGQMNITNTPDFHKNTNYQPGGVASGFDGTLTEAFNILDGMSMMSKFFQRLLVSQQVRGTGLLNRLVLVQALVLNHLLTV